MAAFFDPAPRSKAAAVVYRLFNRLKGADALEGIIGKTQTKLDSLSRLLYLTELVGHRESIGHQLVSPTQANEFEGQLVRRLKCANTCQLLGEWDLSGILLRPLAWLGSDDKNLMIAKYRTHLNDDAFTVNLLRSGVSYAYIDGEPQKRLPWDGYVEAFGSELKGAIERLLDSDSLDPEDRDTFELAIKYAGGWYHVDPFANGPAEIES